MIMSGDAVKKIALIGGGKMGEAIMAGLIRSQEQPAFALDATCFEVANPGAERRAYLEETYGVSCVEDGSLISDTPDVVILAVKPQVLPAVTASLRACSVFGGTSGADAAEKKPLFVSIAAGITTQALRSLLPKGARGVRTMPNTPLLVSAGMTAVVGDGGASASDVELVRALFACLGDAVVVEETAMDAVCAVSGSGPAYVAAFIDALRDGGVKQGLPFDLAQSLALQTVFGTAQLLRETKQTPEAVRKAVCSPGGTTLAALDAMNEADFSSIIDKGVAAATKRSLELGALS